MPRKKTVKVRCYQDMKEDLELKFPGVSMADLLKTAYHTSPLRLEAALRTKKKKKDNELI